MTTTIKYPFYIHYLLRKKNYASRPASSIR